MQRLILPPLIITTLASCATTPPIDTPSGRPEIFVDGVAATDVHAALMARYMSKAWMLREETPSQIVFWKENDNVMANAFLGSQYDPTTTVEVRFILTERDLGTQVYAQAAILTNEGSAFEQRNDMTSGRSGYDLWQALLEVESQLESQPGVGAYESASSAMDAEADEAD